VHSALLSVAYTSGKHKAFRTFDNVIGSSSGFCSFSVRGNLHVSLSPAARYRSANRTQFHRCSFDHRSSAPRMVSSSRMEAGGRLSTAPRMQAKSAWGPPTAGVPIICPSTGEYKLDDMVDASKSRCRMLRLPQIDEY